MDSKHLSAEYKKTLYHIVKKIEQGINHDDVLPDLQDLTSRITTQLDFEYFDAFVKDMIKKYAIEVSLPEIGFRDFFAKHNN